MLTCIKPALAFGRWVSSLVSERGRPSLGRVAFWILFAVALYHYPTLTSEWVTVLIALLGYCVASKMHDRSA